MIALEYSALSAQLTGIVMPVAIYFLLLGLFNSRRRPQLLSARLDFALLILALSPLFLVPIVNALGGSLWSLLAAIALLLLAMRLMAPARHAWVIYNISLDDARMAVSQALRRASVDYQDTPDGYRFGQGAIRLTGFAPLRNVSIRITGGGDDYRRRFEAALERTLSARPAETSPMAVALLLVATVMLAAPTMMMVQRAPEIVRLLGGLLH